MINTRGSATNLLDHARAVLSGRHPIDRSHAARAAAVLARQALEDTVRDRCDAWGISDPRVNMRSKLVTIRSLGSRAEADLASTAWSGLSGACHHHAYELSPTPAEVQDLIDRVTRLIELVNDSREEGNAS